MIYTKLPKVNDNKKHELEYFPSRFHAAVFRLWETVRADKLLAAARELIALGEINFQISRYPVLHKMEVGKFHPFKFAFAVFRFLFASASAALILAITIFLIICTEL